MVALDTVLWLLEVLLVPLSLIGLVFAIARHGRIRRWVVVAVVTGLTVAQPFGVVARRVRRLPVASAGTSRGITSIHVARLFGVPVAPFVLYRASRLAGENTPMAVIKARSWFWLPLLINAATVTESDGPPDLPQPGDTLVLVRHGDWYVSAIRKKRLLLGATNPIGTWRIGFGIASKAGAVYWLIMLVLLPIAWWRVRRR